MDLGRWRRPAGMAFAEAGFILALGLTLTGAAWWALDQQAEAIAQQRFSAVAENVAQSTVKRMGDYEQVLRGAVALIEASEVVSRDEWRTYVERLAVQRTYPGIQGIGFALHVPGERLAIHEAAIRAEGFPDYSVQPPGRRPDTFPIVFLEPFDERNRRAFGYDMFSDPVRNAAMTRARDTSGSALTGPVTLVQEIDEAVQAGTLLYLPVYSQGTFLGFVYSPFRMDDLMLGILGERIEEVGVRLYDGAIEPENLLFDRSSGVSQAFGKVLTVDVYGRSWVMVVSARPGLAAVLDSEQPQTVLAAGFIISLLLMWLVQSRARERARSVALERSNRELAQARQVAERARQEAEAADAAKSKFLAAASHDIRQPVQSIMLLTDVLGQQLSGHAAAHLIEPLDQSLDALRTLLNGLLDISKLDAGVVEAHPAPVDLAEVLARLGSEYRLRARSQNLDLRAVPCRTQVLSDKAQLERILRNLLENALRYTARGRILLGCRRDGVRVRVEIHDTGIGIPPDQIGQIFQEFHQVANPQRDRTQGLGLGLAIVRRLAAILDHPVGVTSRPGHGSCFSLSLPRAEAPTSDTAPLPEPPHLP